MGLRNGERFRGVALGRLFLNDILILTISLPSSELKNRKGERGRTRVRQERLAFHCCCRNTCCLIGHLKTDQAKAVVVSVERTSVFRFETDSYLWRFFFILP